MTQKVLLGYDGRSESEDALHLAILIAETLEATLVVAGILTTGALPSRGSRSEASEYAEASTQRAAREIGERAPSLTIERRTLAARTPAKGLRELARMRNVSVVVVGSTTRAALGATMFGTTAEQLCSNAPCPVAVAPRGYRQRPVKELRVIGVAFDARHEARRALAAAVSLAERAAAGLRVFGAVEPVRLHGAPVPPVDVGSTEPRFNPDVLDRELEQVLAGLPDEIAGQKVILEGDPADALVDAGERACDLLVVGSRVKGLLPVFLPHSVSFGVMESAPWPVVVVSARAGLALLMDECQAWPFEHPSPTGPRWKPPAFTRRRERRVRKGGEHDERAIAEHE
jgi:nucleotide-binding universal stress UspA family protein